MIELSTNTAVMLYLVVTLSAVLGMWIFHHYSTRKKKIILAAQELQVCEYCHFVYLIDLEKEITQCPQCRSFNKRLLKKL